MSFLFTFMMNPTMNLISWTYHKCSRKEYRIVVPCEYLIITPKSMGWSIFIYLFKIESTLTQSKCIYVLSSLLETWTPIFASYTLEILILVEWSSHQGYAVVIRWSSWPMVFFFLQCLIIIMVSNICLIFQNDPYYCFNP